MQRCRTPAMVEVALDDPNLISSASPVLRVALAGTAGMCSGANSIRDMSILRHGRMGRAFADC